MKENYRSKYMIAGAVTAALTTVITTLTMSDAARQHLNSIVGLGLIIIIIIPAVICSNRKS